MMHKHRWIYGHSWITARYWWDVGPDDFIWATTAPGWANWYWSSVGVGLAHGFTQFTFYGRFDPERYLEILSRYPIANLCATSTEYRVILAHVPNPASYRGKIKLGEALSAGKPLNAEVIDSFRDALRVTLRDGYGQTELVCLVATTLASRLNSDLWASLPGLNATVIDEEGNPVGPGRNGEVAVEVGTPGIFAGYWKNPELTRQVFSGRWYRTGDLVRVDEEGYFFFEGRAGDIIPSAGYRIGPFEVESALVSHPAVAESVVGPPHPGRGEIVKAFVILASGCEPSEELVRELQNYVREITAPYKHPRETEFVTELPKASSGKIKRAELRKGEYERKNGISGKCETSVVAKCR